MATEQELQNGVTVEQAPVAAQTLDAEPASLDAEPSAAEPEPLPEKVQKVINRKHFQYHEEKRKNEALQKRIQELEAKQQLDEPIVPDIPDVYDTEYTEKLAARDKAIAARAQWEATKNVAAERQQREVQTQQQKQVAQAQQRDAEFLGRALTQGISHEESLVQQQTITPYLAPELATYLLDDPKGPLIVKHLASDAMELEKIASMPPLQAAVYINQAITPKLKAPTKTISGAPDPAERVGGGAGAAIQTQDQFLTGVTLE